MPQLDQRKVLCLISCRALRSQCQANEGSSGLWALWDLLTCRSPARKPQKLVGLSSWTVRLSRHMQSEEHTFAFPPQAEMQLATAKWRTLRRVARHPHSCAIFKADLRAEHSSGLRGIVLACQWRWAGSGSGKEFEAVEHMHPFSGPKQQVKSIRLEFVWHEALCKVSCQTNSNRILVPTEVCPSEPHRWSDPETALTPSRCQGRAKRLTMHIRSPRSNC